MYALCVRATTGQVTPALPSPGHMPQPPGKPHTPQWRRNGRFQRPTVTSSGQRSLPTANGHFQWPTVTSSGQRSLPVAISNSQRPLPMANAHFQRPLPMVNGHFQRSTATSNGRFQRPTAASNGRFQRPLPTAKCLPHPRAGGEGCRGGSGRVALSLVCRRVVSLVAAPGPGATASPGGQPPALSRRPPESERLSMKAGSFGTGVKKPPPRPAPFFGRRPQQGAASFFGPNKAIFVYLFMYWEIKIGNA